MGLEFETMGEKNAKPERGKKAQKARQQAVELLTLWSDCYREYFGLTYYVTPDDFQSALSFAESNPNMTRDELVALIKLCLREFPKLPLVRYLTSLYRSRVLPTFKIFVQSINDVAALERSVLGDWIYEEGDWIKVKGGVRL